MDDLKKKCEAYAEEIRGITHTSKMKDRGNRNKSVLGHSDFLFESGDQQIEDGIILCFFFIGPLFMDFICLKIQLVVGVSENPCFHFQIGSSRVSLHIQCHSIPSMLASSSLLLQA